jgi:hypothetical protein
LRAGSAFGVATERGRPFLGSRILGHTSVATTASLRGRVQPSMLRRSADHMDELMRVASGGAGARTGQNPQTKAPPGHPWRGISCSYRMVSRQGFEP